MRKEEQLPTDCGARPRADATAKGALAACPGKRSAGPDVSLPNSLTQQAPAKCGWCLWELAGPAPGPDPAAWAGGLGEVGSCREGRCKLCKVWVGKPGLHLPWPVLAAMDTNPSSSNAPGIAPVTSLLWDGPLAALLSTNTEG